MFNCFLSEKKKRKKKGSLCLHREFPCPMNLEVCVDDYTLPVLGFDDSEIIILILTGSVWLLSVRNLPDARHCVHGEGYTNNQDIFL